MDAGSYPIECLQCGDPYIADVEQITVPEDQVIDHVNGRIIGPATVYRYSPHHPCPANIQDDDGTDERDQPVSGLLRTCGVHCGTPAGKVHHCQGSCCHGPNWPKEPKR